MGGITLHVMLCTLCVPYMPQKCRLGFQNGINDAVEAGEMTFLARTLYPLMNLLHELSCCLRDLLHLHVTISLLFIKLCANLIEHSDMRICI